VPLDVRTLLSTPHALGHEEFDKYKICKEETSSELRHLLPSEPPSAYWELNYYSTTFNMFWDDKIPKTFG